MLTKPFEAVLLLTPWVTVLAALLLAARRWLLQNRQAARALRLAWLVLAARCAVPVRLTLPRLAASRPEPPAWSAPVLVQPERVPGIPLRLDTAAAASPPPATGPSLSELLMILWALGALCFVAVQLTRHLVFCRQLCRCRVRLPLWGRIYRSPGARVPVTVGLLRPAVYLPVSLAPDDLPFVLAHERHHIRAGDLWFQLLLLAAQTLHWFNPLVHRMALAARQDMERACDAAVLQNKPLPYRLRYGETVLAALKNARRQAVLSAPPSGADPFQGDVGYAYPEKIPAGAARAALRRGAGLQFIYRLYHTAGKFVPGRIRSGGLFHRTRRLRPGVRFGAGGPKRPRTAEQSVHL